MILFFSIIASVALAATPAAAAPVTLFLVTTLQSIGFGAAIAASLAGYAVNALINVAVGLLTKALFGGDSAVARGITAMVREPTASQKIIYGTRRASGPITYIESTGKDGKYLHIVVLLAAHECNDITDVYFNDELVWSGGTYEGDWASYARVSPHLGSDTQVADTDLVAESGGHWTNDHKLSGHAYLYVRLLFDQDKFTSGLPNISAIVEGRKIYDPRDSSTAFSANPALCIRDYMFDAKHGMAIGADEWDEAGCITLANLCDEAVTTLDGGTQARFECNAVVDTSADHGNVLEALLVTCLGGVVYPKGQFSIFGSEYRTPTITLTEDDLAGAVDIQTAITKRQSYNGVKGRFVPALNNYTDDEYPAVLSSVYEVADGEPEYLSVDFPFETDSERAQRNAKLILNKSRQRITFSAEFKMTAFEVVPGDNVMLTLSRYGFSAKVFEVLTAELNVHGIGLTIKFSLRETASGVYDWTASDADEYLAGPPTTLPNPLDISAPTFVLSDELRQQAGGVVIALVVDLSAYESVFVSSFIVEGKLATDTDWTTFGSGLQSKFEWLGVSDGAIYDIRARVVSLLGARSDYYQRQYAITAFSSPPDDVTNFQINVVNGQANLTWDSVADLSVSSYIIRRSPLLTGAVYNGAETVAADISAPSSSVSLPYRSGTYFIRAVDNIGNESVSPVSVTTNVGVIEGLNAIVTVTESPNFSGEHVGAAQNWDGFLLLENGDNLLTEYGDRIVLEQAVATGLLIKDVSGAAPSGAYEFATVTDLGAKYTSRVEAQIEFIRNDESGELFDDASGLFDSRAGLFDGGEFSDANAKLQVSLTDDDPVDVEDAFGIPDHVEYQGAQLPNFYLATAERQADVFIALDIDMPVSPDDGETIIDGGNDVTSEGFFAGFAGGWEVGSSAAGQFVVRFGGAAVGHPTDCAKIDIDPSVITGRSGRLLIECEITTQTLNVWFWDHGAAAPDLIGTDTASAAMTDWWSVWKSGVGIVGQDNRTCAHEGRSGNSGINLGGQPFTGKIREMRMWTQVASGPAFSGWSNWIDFFVGDFSARGLKFNAVLESTATGVSPLVTSLAAKIDMPDRIIAEDDLVSGAGAYAVTFSPAFKGLTGMGITEISGMTTGDTYAISAKSAAGFTIHFKDSGGTSVSRTFSYAARGYGKVI